MFANKTFLRDPKCQTLMGRFLVQVQVQVQVWVRNMGEMSVSCWDGPHYGVVSAFLVRGRKKETACLLMAPQKTSVDLSAPGVLEWTGIVPKSPGFAYLK